MPDLVLRGLAVLAASLLTRLGAPPDRLVAALPSLGDWPWRAGRYCNGSGARVNVLVESLRQEGRAVSATLRLFDAVYNQAMPAAQACEALAALPLPGALVDGFARGRPGLHALEAA